MNFGTGIRKINEAYEATKAEADSIQEEITAQHAAGLPIDGVIVAKLQRIVSDLEKRIKELKAEYGIPDSQEGNKL